MNLADLGKRIRSQREKRRLTQAQLANSLHISAQAISKWERGENAPDISILKQLSLLLGKSIEWILIGNDEADNTFEATILCSSMRDFAKHSSNKSPEKIALFINGIFHTMTEAALIENGVPIKYVGDGFLAYFSGENHKTRALRAASAITEAISEVGLLLTLNSGEVYLGAMGHHEYARPDIIGDSVNFAFIMNRWGTDSSAARLIISSSLKDEACSLNMVTKQRDDSSLSETIYEVE